MFAFGDATAPGASRYIKYSTYLGPYLVRGVITQLSIYRLRSAGASHIASFSNSTVSCTAPGFTALCLDVS